MEVILEHILIMSQSIAVILIAAPVIDKIRQKSIGSPLFKSILAGLMFLLIGVLVMLNPVAYEEGVQSDPRNSIVAIATAFHGPVAALITMAGLTFQRLSLGGWGAIPGSISVLFTGFVSLILWFYMSRFRHEISRHNILAYAVIAAVTPSLVGVFVPGITLEKWIVYGALMAPANFVAVALPGIILLRNLERKEYFVQVRDKQARLDSISENAPSILFEIELDEDGAPRFTHVSKASERILDLTPETLQESFAAFDTMLPVSSRSTIRSMIRDSAEVGASWTFETEAVRADRKLVLLQIAARSRLNAEGRSAWDGTIADVTDQRKLDRMKEDFIAVVSHELKTPVTAIHGSLGLIASAAVGEPNAKITRLVGMAERNAERLMSLVNDIIEMQQLRTESLRLNMVAHEVRPLLEQAVETARADAVPKNIEVILAEDFPDAVIDVDPDRLQQILANLLSNAIKFSPKGAIVLVLCDLTDDWLRISIQDNGPGIPVEFHPHVFDAFTQAELPGTRSAGGTGIGLKITKTLVEELGGRIHFEPKAGHGTVFHVDLPHDADRRARTDGDTGPSR